MTDLPRSHDKKFWFVLLGIVALSAMLFWPARSDLVRQKIEEIARHLSFEGGLHPIGLLTFATELSREFADPVKVKIIYQGEEHIRNVSREEAKGHLAVARKELSQLAVKIDGLTISRIGSEQARADMTVKAMGRTGERSDYFLEVFSVNLLLKKDSVGEWIVEQIEGIDQRGAQIQD